MTVRRRVLTMPAMILLVLVLMICAVPSRVFAEGGDTVTKSDWMDALVAAFELGNDDIALFPEDFSSDSDAPATREFAAVTVNFFVGYELNQGLTYSFSDTEAVTDKNSAEFAVRKGLLTLIDGAFSPSTPITSEEMADMLPAAKLEWEQPYTMVLPDDETYARVAGFQAEADGQGVRRILYIPKKLGGRPVEYVDSNAFQNNTDIITVNIPDTVIQIGSNAFNGCTGITKVSIPVDFHYTYSTHPFNNCTGVTEIRYREGQTGIMPDVSQGSGSTYNNYTDRLEFSVRNTLEKVSFDEGITRIGNGAYYFARDTYIYLWPKLKTVELP